MKQVKKVLVILPLVALFVLGSLPVFAAGPTEGVELTIEYQNADGSASMEGAKVFKLSDTKALPLSGIQWSEKDTVKAYAEIQKLAGQLKAFVMGTLGNLQDGYQPVEDSFLAAASAIFKGDEKAAVKAKAQVRLAPVINNRRRVIAFNIHANRIQFDQICEVELNPDYESPVGIIEAFFNKSDLPTNYTMVGYVIAGHEPVITRPIAGLEKINIPRLEATMSSPNVNAQYAALVVPNFIRVEARHIFPEGTRTPLSEIVPVPYETWAHLQTAWRLVDVPTIFRTRIQKVNEQGFTFRSIEYYNGLTPVTGLLSSWDWANYDLGGDENEPCVARIYYDVAVAAAKEVPSEKKVDAATAPQAQLQAPAAAQVQAPVTAANTTTTTAPVNTLPVTGASDSIFLFLSSAALMAVGILFFKKH